MDMYEKYIFYIKSTVKVTNLDHGYNRKIKLTGTFSDLRIIPQLLSLMQNFLFQIDFATPGTAQQNMLKQLTAESLDQTLGKCFHTSKFRLLYL